MNPAPEPCAAAAPSAFHPAVAAWFAQTFDAATAAQERGWAAIARGQDTLIAAPTGSGKTLAAFLWCLDGLFREACAGTLTDRVSVLYVSPLKALGNDIRKNLEAPLSGIAAELALRGQAAAEIRAEVRSGDTPAAARARMVRRPPHILVTTPESLYLLLTSEKGRDALASVWTVIVDEIHAVAGSKRGSHLALSLERLDALVAARAGHRPVRIGLSATQRPIELVARLLVGAGRDLPQVVDTGHRRALDLAIEIPDEALAAVAGNATMDRIWDRIAALVAEHRTTLVFVNTRRLAERAAHALGQRVGEDRVAAHHGSLSRERRLRAEQRLKTADVACIVATASLELGIDVGEVELVVQLGSPRGIATFLQRVGRSGHSLGAIPKGRLFALTRDELVECTALVRAVHAGELDRLCVPDAPLDILAQQIVAAAACEPWPEDALFALVRQAAPYAGLARADFDAVLTMLADGIATSRGRTGALLHRDAVGRVVRGRRGARITALTSGGAIPDRADYTVVAEPDEVTVGTLDEDFAIESMAGDIFLLGNTSWRVRQVRQGQVRVEDAAGRPPTIPFWFGEAPGRSAELSGAVSDLREDVAAGLHDRAALAGRLASEAGLSRRSECCRRRGRWWRSASSTRPAACSSSSMRRSARGSTGRWGWRCASASAGPSTSSSRPRRPTTVWSSRWGRSTASPWRRCSGSWSRTRWSTRWCRRCSRRPPCSPCAGAGTPRGRWRCPAGSAGAGCRRRSSGSGRTTSWRPCSRRAWRARRT